MIGPTLQDAVRHQADRLALGHHDLDPDFLRAVADRMDVLEARAEAERTLTVTAADGEVLATLSPDDTRLFIDGAIHHMFDTVIVPFARRVAAAHGAAQ